MKLHPCRSLRHCHQKPPLNRSDQDPNHALTSQPSLPSIPTLALQPSNHLIHPLTTLKSQTCSTIFSLTLSPSHHLFSASSNGEVRRHNHPLTSSSVVVPAANCAVKCVLLLNNKLITSHKNKKIRVWKMSSYTLLSTLPTLTDRVKSMTSSKMDFQHHDVVSALALSSDNSLLYSVSWDRSLKAWRTSDFRCVESVQNAHSDAINAVVTSADGRVFTCSADRTIKVWRRKNEVSSTELCLVSTLTKHKSAINALAVSQDGSVLYSGACDRSVLVWESGGEEGEGLVVSGALRGHVKAILCLCVLGAGDGLLVCSGSADGTVRVWRRSGGEALGYGCLGVFGGGGSGGVKSLVAKVVEEGRRLVVYDGSLEGEIRAWELQM